GAARGPPGYSTHDFQRFADGRHWNFAPPAHPAGGGGNLAGGDPAGGGGADGAYPAGFAGAGSGLSTAACAHRTIVIAGASLFQPGTAAHLLRATAAVAAGDSRRALRRLVQWLAHAEHQFEQ